MAGVLNRDVFATPRQIPELGGEGTETATDVVQHFPCLPSTERCLSNIATPGSVALIAYRVPDLHYCGRRHLADRGYDVVSHSARIDIDCAPAAVKPLGRWGKILGHGFDKNRYCSETIR